MDPHRSTASCILETCKSFQCHDYKSTEILRRGLQILISGLAGNDQFCLRLQAAGSSQNNYPQEFCCINPTNEALNELQYKNQ